MEHTGSLREVLAKPGYLPQGWSWGGPSRLESLGAQTFYQNSGKGGKLMSKGLPKDILD